MGEDKSLCSRDLNHNLQCISSHSSSSRMCQGLTTSRLYNSQLDQQGLSSLPSNLLLEGNRHITNQHLYSSSPISQPPSSRPSSSPAPSPSRSNLHSSSSSSSPIPGLSTRLTQISIFTRQTTMPRGLTPTQLLHTKPKLRERVTATRLSTDTHTPSLYLVL